MNKIPRHPHQRTTESGAQGGTRQATVWIVLAALTCPCHLPLLILLLSGTAGGAWLAEHTSLALSTMGVLFVFALIGVWRRLSAPAPITPQPANPHRMDQSVEDE